jgi:8-oxo-dGTP pyrophosphatase MutT (NUDIX family)
MMLSHLSEEEIASRLARAADSVYTPEAPHSEYPEELLRLAGGPPRAAAVLIPLLKVENEWNLLFTRRTDHLPEHSGQVAFPGGRMDPEDASPEETALREAYEEIGLEPARVRLLGRTDSFVTITNYCVTPVAGIIPWPFEIHLAEAEVSRVFTIPLDWLADEANIEITQRVLPHPNPPIPVIYFKKYDGELLWGVSAQITLNLLRILRGDLSR